MTMQDEQMPTLQPPTRQSTTATTNLSILCVAILSWLEVAVVKGAAFSSLWLKFKQVIFVRDR